MFFRILNLIDLGEDEILGTCSSLIKRDELYWKGIYRCLTRVSLFNIFVHGTKAEVILHYLIVYCLNNSNFTNALINNHWLWYN